MDHLTRLLLNAQHGDAGALDRFIGETQGEVWRLCRYLGDADDADDLAQETFERAISSLHRFRADGSARSWLLSIARRVCADHVRRAQRRRRRDRAVLDESRVDAGAGHAIFADPTGTVDLDELLAALTADRRAAFVLTQVLGLYYDEAAEVLDCPVGTIRSRVSRARRDLHAMMPSADGQSGNDATAGTDHPPRATGST